MLMLQASRTGEASQVWTAVDGTQSWDGVFKVCNVLRLFSADVFVVLSCKGSSGLVCDAPCFQVKWQTIFDLSFNDTMHLRNPLNEDKPIKISRDGQEVQRDVGFQVCKIFDEGYVANPSQSMKRRRIEAVSYTHLTLPTILLV